MARKRCRIGKSCGATCIARTKQCPLEMSITLSKGLTRMTKNISNFGRIKTKSLTPLKRDSGVDWVRNGVVFGTSPRNAAIDSLNEIKRDAEDYKRQVKNRMNEPTIQGVLKVYAKRIKDMEKFIRAKNWDDRKGNQIIQ